jgi:hypothetical protein
MDWSLVHSRFDRQCTGDNSTICTRAQHIESHAGPSCTLVCSGAKEFVYARRCHSLKATADARTVRASGMRTAYARFVDTRT